jgi:gluconokinase
VVLGENEETYPLETPFPNWAEQNPLTIEKASIMAIRQLIDTGINPNHIVAVGMSSAMHSLICMTHEGMPLSPSITWADGRAAEQAIRIKELGLPLYQKTGTLVHPMSPLVKLLWMKETNYEPYHKATKFVSIKEFLLFRWFKTEQVDYSVASATGMLDLETLQWNSDALQVAGITEDNLFQPVPPTTVIRNLDRTVASEMGLPVDVPFVIGGSDGPLANLGIGAIERGEVAITIGTSGAIRQIVSEVNTDPAEQTFCYRFTDQFSVIGGPTNNGGIVLNWLKDTLRFNGSYDSMMSLAEKAGPGAEGLLFSPYLNGERAPMWNSKMRGNLFGLTLRHSQEHIIRAGLEGVIFSVYHVGQALEKLAGPPTKLLASGGFARSPLWLQILADVFNQEVHVPKSHQSSAWGAAWIALYALGEVNSLEAIKEHIPMEGLYKPDPENHQIYMESFDHYKKLAEIIDQLTLP